VSREDAVPLYRRLKSEAGWKRHAAGFKNTIVGVGLDVCVEGERTSPGSTEEFPSPAELKKVGVRPFPVPALSELIALKVMSGRARDDADVVEPLKRHRRRMVALRRAASRRLRTKGGARASRGARRPSAGGSCPSALGKNDCRRLTPRYRSDS
jgi:hypothetical protein